MHRTLIAALALLFAAPVPAQNEETPQTTEALEAQLSAARDAFGPGDLRTVTLQSRLANSLFRAGRFTEAEPLYLLVLQQRAEQLGDEDPATLGSLNNLGLLYVAQGRYAEAEPLYLRALEARRRVQGDFHAGTLGTMENLANLYAIQGRYDEGVRLSQQLLEAHNRIDGPGHPATLLAMNNLAVVQQMQGRLYDAEALFHAVLEHRETLADSNSPDLAAARNNLALLYQAQGRYGEAEPLLKQVRDARAQSLGPAHPETIAAVNNLALLFQSQGRFDAAEPLLISAFDGLSRTLGERHPNAIGALTNLALLYQSQGRLADAAPLHLRVFEAREAALGPDHPDTLAALGNVAYLYQAQGHFTDAERLYREAINRGARALGEDHFLVLNAMNNLAATLAAQGSLADAETLYLQTLAGRLRTMPGTHPELATTYAGLGRVALAQGTDPARASLFLKRAVNILQAARQNMAALEPDTHRAFVDKWADIYLDLQASLIRQGRLAEAEQVGRMVKDAEYSAFVRGAPQGDTAGQLSLTATESGWETQLTGWFESANRLAENMAALDTRRRDGEVLSASETAEFARLHAASDQAFATMRLQLRASAGTGSRGDDGVSQDEQARALNEAATAGMQATVAQIAPDAALLQVVALADGLHLFLITPSDFTHVEVPVDRETLFSSITAARALIEEGRDPVIAELPDYTAELHQSLGQLHQWLIAPIAAQLTQAGTKTLMLNLQGQVRYLPFAALWDGDGWLTERYRLALYTPAARTTFEPHTEMISGQAFGLTQSSGDFVALPGVADELRMIMGSANDAGVLEGDFALDNDFTLAALESGLGDPLPVLHIASHFQINPGDEASSYLVLGDGSALTLAQINRSPRIDFRGIELLTLSACETALGGDGTGLEIEGFGALAQYKGAASVIATLWQVSDDTTPSFMRDLYDGIARHGLDKAPALQAAQLALIRSEHDSHPFYWAPFILMGNWR